MIRLTKEFEHLKIQLAAIKLATNNFADDRCIGKGGFGKVYKGEIVIPSQGHTTVAIKRLDRAFGQGDNEFWKEIIMLSVYKHKNIVSLLGFCDECNEKILIYQYASKGSLDLYLDNGDLTWIRRLNICIGAARGLAFLHNPGATQQRVLHRDIKSSNILLDDHWNARISDLGLSKFGPANQQYTFLVSHAVGTIGYCDPQYVQTGLLTKESDVYSFGVVLFEILCGRLCIGSNSNDDKHRPFTLMVRQYYKENKINEIIYSNIQDEINPESLNAFTKIAYQCLKIDHEERPLMTDVVSMLENAFEYQISSMYPSRTWKLTEISEPSQCCSLRLPDSTSSAMRVSRLIYTNSGLAILALAANGVHKVWKWPRNDHSSTGKATAIVIPQLWQPTSGILMTNEISDTNREDAVPCFALSKNDLHVMSASGGKISLFNMMTFKTMTTFMSPPPAATFLAFHPQDDNIIAIGMEDSSIHIYNLRLDEIKTKLKGHHKRITGLAFSNALNVLVSSGADSQLCVWKTNGWEKQTSKFLQIPVGCVAAPLADTRVQFHHDHTHLLVVHETQISVYKAPKLKSPNQWFPPETSGLITHATYSCDSQSIFVGFEDASVGILTSSTLRLRCRITSTAYLPSNPKVHPLVIAAHPSKPDQFALGLSDGGVCVLEPLKSKEKCDKSPPTREDGGAGLSRTTPGAANTTNPAQRLEQESGFYFNMRYFEEMVTNGEWDEVEKYLSGFTKVDDNRYSMKIFFEIRKQKYLEALDKKDRSKAVDILVKDLKVFSAFNEDLFKEITQLLILDNFRDNEQLSKYGDTKSARGIMLVELKKLIEANPLFRDKLNFPSLKKSRLGSKPDQFASGVSDGGVCILEPLESEERWGTSPPTLEDGGAGLSSTTPGEASKQYGSYLSYLKNNILNNSMHAHI